MYLYDKEGQKVNIKPVKELGSGIQGKVYLLSDNTCIKVFSGVKNDYRIIELIKKLNLNGFYSIYDLYYDKSSKFKGYTMSYHNKEDIDIITEPTEYTLDNLEKLYKSISKLTELGVIATDLHTDNVIMNKEGITVIDADLYDKTVLYNNEKLMQKNINAVFSLFRQLYLGSIDSNTSEYNPLYSNTIISLFNHNIANPVEVTTKKLGKYKYPIDYLKHESK